MNNPYSSTGAAACATPNYGRKPPGKFMRQVTNGIGLGLCVLLLCTLQLSLDLYNLPPGFGWLTDDYNLITVAEGIGYLISFTLAYYTVKAAVGISGVDALPWGDVKPRFAFFAVCFGLGCSILGAVLTQMLNDAIAGLTGQTPTMPEIPTPDTALGWVIYLISISVLPAIFEEILFRGVVLQSLRQFGDRFAVLGSAFVFALGHGNLVQGPNSFFMGIIMGGLVVYTGSLKIGILMHFCNNFLFTLVGAADSISGGLPDIFATVFFALIVVFGVYGAVSLGAGGYRILPPGCRGGAVNGALKPVHLITTPMMLIYILLCLGITAIYFAPQAAV